MDLKIKKISLGKIDSRRFSAGAFSFFEKNMQLFFFLSLIGIISYSGFIWYKFVYKAEWSETKKQEYIRSKDRGAVFNRAAFESIVSEREKRRSESENNMDGIVDIFCLDCN